MAGVLLPVSFLGAQAVDEEIDQEEVVNLSPFVVDTAQDEGYVATQTLAGGRLNQSLKDSGAAIQVITKDFMDDIGATGIEELLQYAPGTSSKPTFRSTATILSGSILTAERIPSSSVSVHLPV